MKNYKEEKERELDRIEEELLKEEQESRKMPMQVSGKSVFELKRIKDEKGDKKK